MIFKKLGVWFGSTSAETVHKKRGTVLQIMFSSYRIHLSLARLRYAPARCTLNR